MSARPEIKRMIFGWKITNIAGTAFLAEIMDYYPDLLAHPYQMGLPDKELEAVVAQLKDWGLDAIECYYPKYSAGQQTFYLRLAEKYRLRQTGGSDFHGEKVKPDIRLAKRPLALGWLIDN